VSSRSRSETGLQRSPPATGDSPSCPSSHEPRPRPDQERPGAPAIRQRRRTLTPRRAPVTRTAVSPRSAAWSCRAVTPEPGPAVTGLRRSPSPPSDVPTDQPGQPHPLRQSQRGHKTRHAEQVRVIELSRNRCQTRIYRVPLFPHRTDPQHPPIPAVRCPAFLGQWIRSLHSDERRTRESSKEGLSPEFREDAVRLVIDSSRPIASVARELQIGEGTLGNWVSVYRRDHVGEEPGLDVSERAGCVSWNVSTAK